MNELFAKILLADEPHKNFRDKLSMYEPLIGNWEFEWKGNVDGSELIVPGEWLFAWVLEGPAMSQINIFKAKKEDGMIVQEEILTAPGAKPAKWIFRDISQTGFTWQAYASDDGAKTWALVSEVAAWR